MLKYIKELLNYEKRDFSGGDRLDYYSFIGGGHHRLRMQQ